MDVSELNWVLNWHSSYIAKDTFKETDGGSKGSNTLSLSFQSVEKTRKL